MSDKMLDLLRELHAEADAIAEEWAEVNHRLAAMELAAKGGELPSRTDLMILQAVIDDLATRGRNIDLKMAAITAGYPGLEPS